MTCTTVFFHAHPDDEAIFTGGTMSRLAAAGHRVVLVMATRGEQGLPRTQMAVGEPLADRRSSETQAAATLLGAARVEFLDYLDSGMLGDESNHADGAFAAAPVAVAATALADICVQEQAAALVIYDRNGIYGHPDHVQVHTVGLAAAALAGTKTIYECTVDYEYLHFVDTHLVEGASPSMAERARVGLTTAEISTSVDVRAVLVAKRAAMTAHASQIPDTQLAAPGEPFAAVYGWEWYVRRGPRGSIEALDSADQGALGARP